MSFSETIFLFFLALIIFGPKKLPEIARQVGRYLNEFRRASNEFKAQIEQEISHLEREEAHKILPPNETPSGTASRNQTVATGEPLTQDKPAILASTPEATEGHASLEGSANRASEADPAADELARASQEFHA